ncbi:MAG: hypothetical protein LUQ02_00300 [Methanothrix sp.]|nr:hypothetical protein [Methanothrix sp.]OYV14534.1 MAG: hypothetical protein CG445_61 [Methanosaeta sp. ASM2]
MGNCGLAWGWRSGSPIALDVGTAGARPGCAIRLCAREMGYGLCSSCADLEGCTRFDWLRQHGQEVRDLLKESRGCRRRVYLEDEIFLLIRTIL